MDSMGMVRSSKWKRRSINHQSCRIPILLAFFLLLFCFAFYISSNTLISTSFLTSSGNAQFPLFPQCANAPGGEKYLWYAPHSGFSNQLSEFKNAILMAAILNRTLIIPPIFDHHAVALGSCPKFRVLNPSDLRFKAWNHTIELIRDRRYISMADIIDLSSLMSISAIRFIDFRAFASTWCGVNFSLACANDASIYSSLHVKLKQCGSLLSGYDVGENNCVYSLQEDCRTTVWTYQTDEEDGILDSFQADDVLNKKKKVSFLRKRKNVWKALGPGSAAGQANVLAFGSLFTSPYKGSESHIDFHKAPRDHRIRLLIQKLEFLPFVPEILNAGKKFALETIKAPFLCAQLRLLDGQFKNHVKATFLGFKQKLDSLKKNGPLPIHVFVMTDLPLGNWTGSHLGDLSKDLDTFKLFFLREEDELVAQTAKKLVSAGHSIKFQSVSTNLNGREQDCYALSLPDILLYIEETICSCASLGFLGTAGSTIAESIALMRNNDICLG